MEPCPGHLKPRESRFGPQAGQKFPREDDLEPKGANFRPYKSELGQGSHIWKYHISCDVAPSQQKMFYKF